MAGWPSWIWSGWTRLVVAAAATVLACPVLVRPALATTPVHRVYGTGQGLSSHIYNLVQDPTGVIWGAEDGGGIVAFDGVRVVNYSTREGLPSNSFNGIAIAADGRLWVTRDDGPPLWMYHTSRGVWHITARPPESGFVGSYHLIETRAGDMLMASDVGVHRLQNDRWTLFRQPRDPGGRPYKMHHLFQAASGAIYGVARSGMLFRLAPGEPRLLFDGDAGAERTLRLFQGPGNRLLVTGLRQGLMELVGDQLRRATSEAALLPANVAPNCAAWTRDGRLLVGTWGAGVLVFRGGRLLQTIDRRHGLGSVLIESIFEDREGNLFVTAYGGGLWQWVRSKFVHLTPLDGLGDRDVWGFDRSADGTLRVLSDGALVTEFFADGRQRIVDLKRQRVPPSMRGLARDRQGELWVFGEGGAFQVDGGFRVRRRLLAPETLPTNRVYNLAFASDRSILVATADRGLLVIRPDGSLEAYDRGHGLADSIAALLEIRAGVFAVACDAGAGLLDLGARRATLSESANGGLSLAGLLDVARDRQGGLWYASARGVIQLRGDRYRLLSTREGLPQDNVFAVVADGQDGVWVGTAAGIAHIDHTGARVTSYGEKDGMIDPETNAATGFRDRDGTIWFGTPSGAAGLNPATARRNPVAPVPRISQLEVEERPWPGFERAVLPGDMFALELSAEQRTVRVVFSAASFVYPAAVHFHTRLLDSDRDYSRATSSRDLVLKSMLPGNYRLEVIACNEDDVCAQTPARLAIHVRAPFFSSWWFVSSAGAALALLVLVAVRVRIRAHVRRELELERIVRERTEQIRELSLRDPLTGLRNRRFVVEVMRVRGHVPLRLPYGGGPARVPAGVEQRRKLGPGRLGIVMVDLDEFKQVNDTHGHESGDMVLQHCASVFESALRREDTVARWGGEEFLLLVAFQDSGGLVAVAERLRKAVETAEFRIVGGATIRQTCSLGYACFPFRDGGPEDILDWEKVLAVADLGLIRAKKLGRNRSIRVQPGSRVVSSEEVPVMLADLEAAEERGYLVVEETTGWTTEEDSGDGGPQDGDAGEGHFGESKPVDGGSGDGRSRESSSGAGKPGECSPENSTPGEGSPG